MVRIEEATMPALWFSWPEDPHFPPEKQACNYLAAPGPHMVSLVPKMGHGHGAAWNRPEPYDFADSIVKDGGAWCQQTEIIVNREKITVVFESQKPLKSASLVYTSDTDIVTSDITTNQVWKEISLAAPTKSDAGKWIIKATLPEGVVGWYVNAVAKGSVSDVIVSSDFQTSSTN